MTGNLRRGTVLLFAAWLAGCTMFEASVRVRRTDDQPPFTQEEQDRVKEIVSEICRAARFSERAAHNEYPDASDSAYLDFVWFDGKGSEQDTVGVSGAIRRGRREIRVSVGDYKNGDPLPTTQKMVDDLRVALEEAVPESRVVVSRHDESKLFGP